MGNFTGILGFTPTLVNEFEQPIAEVNNASNIFPPPRSK